MKPLLPLPGSMISTVLRYLPFVFIIVFLKLFVVFLTMNVSNYENNYTNFDDYGAQTDDEVTKKRTENDPMAKEKQNILQHLNDTVLVPSSANRTNADSIWLFFNRVPRTGGKTVVSLLKALGEDLDYQHQEHSYRTPWQRLLSNEEQTNLATWFEYNFWPKSYDRHALWINFTQHRSKYLEAKPVYITMVRDPIEKFISYYRYSRLDLNISRSEMLKRDKDIPGRGRKWYWRSLEECFAEKDAECSLEPGKINFVSSIPFLCGQKEQCLKIEDKWALQMAKFNAEYEYSVVGVLEQLNASFSVLEHYVPRFFRGALQRYWSSEFTHRHENRNPKRHKPVPEKLRQLIKMKLSSEYELYEFLKQRLHNQYNSIAHLIPMTSPLPPKTKSPPKLGAFERLQIDLSEV